jgi:hypothetical protein
MNWFYAKDGQRIGPVEFSEIERLHSEGQLTADSLVWQQGTGDWVKLSTVLKSKETIETPTLQTTQPVPAPVESIAKLPDYGDLLCWGILGILIPFAGLAVYIALIVLHFLEFSAARKAVTEGRLQVSDYSKIHPALFLLGLICCSAICYPLFMFFRNRSGYFKPQPHGVWVAVVAVLLSIGINILINAGSTALQESAQ